MFQLDGTGKGLLQLVILQLQFALQIQRRDLVRRQQLEQVSAEYVLLVQLFIEHPCHLRNIAVPLDKAAQQAAELVPLGLRFLVVAVCHRLQDAAHAAHGVFILLGAAEILLGKGFHVCIGIDRKTPQLLLGLVNEVGVDLLLQKGFLIKRLEGLPDVLCLVHKIQHKGVGFAGTGTVQTGEGLHRLDALQLFVHDHGVEQRFVKTGLVFFCHDEHIEVVVELLFGLALCNVAAIGADVQGRLCVLHAAVRYGTGKCR